MTSQGWLSQPVGETQTVAGLLIDSAVSVWQRIPASTTAVQVVGTVIHRCGVASAKWAKWNFRRQRDTVVADERLIEIHYRS